MSTPVVNRARLLETFLELCSIPSPARREERVAARIREIAHEYGARIVDDGVAGPSDGTDAQGNMIFAAPPGRGVPMFLSAHMDTVPVQEDVSRIPVTHHDGVVKTDGTTVLGGDDKAGVAIALEMLALCSESRGRHRDLEVLILVQEEIGCRGSRVFDAGGIRARTGFNLDGEIPPFSAINRAPRKFFYTCSVHGKSAHGALDPDDGINAIRVAADLIPRLPQGTLSENSTGNMGSVRGGKQTNVVPDLVTLKGELRSFSRAELESYRASIEEACRETAGSHGVSIDVEWDHAYDEYYVQEDEEPVIRFVEACRRLGKNPTLLSSRGGGDSNNLNGMGLRNIVFGVGMHNIHSPQEYILEKELYDAADLMVEIVFPEV